MVCQIKEGTVSSLEFWFFIKLLEKILISAINESEDPPLSILDNARVHNSKLTTLFMHSCKLQTKFLPPYWPEIAPVERIFWAVNSKMRSIKFTSDVDFSKKFGQSLILRLLNSFTNLTWSGAWIKVIEEWSRNIKEDESEKKVNEDHD